MKKINKKLSLSKSTLSNLESKSVVGGDTITMIPSCPYTCNNCVNVSDSLIVLCTLTTVPRVTTNQNQQSLQPIYC